MYLSNQSLQPMLAHAILNLRFFYPHQLSLDWPLLSLQLYFPFSMQDMNEYTELFFFHSIPIQDCSYYLVFYNPYRQLALMPTRQTPIKYRMLMTSASKYN